MAATSDRDDLTSSAYTLLASGAAAGLVQHVSGGPVRIAIATSLPGASDDAYILIGSNGKLPLGFSWSGLTTGDNVYGRADDAAAATVTMNS